MATKTELEEDLNEILETDIEWSQLKKEDMKEFKELTQETEFMQTIVANHASEVTGSTVEDQVKNWEPGQYAMLAMSDDYNLTDMLF